MNYYPDNTPIPENLPESYRISTGVPITYGERCDKCKHYLPLTQYCNRWEAQVRPEYYCKKWSKIDIIRKKK